ncbi:MAG: NnrS family protein [Gammaproteobacteria bacterium]|nr:NnrS family protein [Gammaproteobacteria bacterium]
MLLNINEKKSAPRLALFDLGFRPFFMGAGLFAFIAMALWLLSYSYARPIGLSVLLPVTWHAHEMIYGYALAVIFGFLLTAVGNWTGKAMPKGGVLMAMFTLWALVRILPFISLGYQLELAMILELTLILVVYIAVLLPAKQSAQSNNIALVSLLLWMFIGDAVYYAGLLGWLENGVRDGLYLGLYGVVLFILLMARRVVPFFISKGLEVNLGIKERPWLDYVAIIVFVLFVLSDVFFAMPLVSSIFAVVLALLHVYTLVQWYHPDLRKKSLLWSLYLGYLGLVSGFIMKALEPFMAISPTLAVHAFTVSVAIMTLAMMTRVSLGHTGRDVFNPPLLLRWIFLGAIAVFLLRVLLPVLMPVQYALWIELSQWVWLLVFGAFFTIYFPIWCKPRVDA